MSGQNTPRMRRPSLNNLNGGGQYQSDFNTTGSMRRSGGLNDYYYDDDRTFLRDRNDICRSSWNKNSMGKNRRMNFNMNNAKKASHYRDPNRRRNEFSDVRESYQDFMAQSNEIESQLIEGVTFTVTSKAHGKALDACYIYSPKAKDDKNGQLVAKIHSRKLMTQQFFAEKVGREHVIRSIMNYNLVWTKGNNVDVKYDTELSFRVELHPYMPGNPDQLFWLDSMGFITQRSTDENFTKYAVEDCGRTSVFEKDFGVLLRPWSGSNKYQTWELTIVQNFVQEVTHFQNACDYSYCFHNKFVKDKNREMGSKNVKMPRGGQSQYGIGQGGIGQNVNSVYGQGMGDAYGQGGNGSFGPGMDGAYRQGVNGAYGPGMDGANMYGNNSMYGTSGLRNSNCMAKTTHKKLRRTRRPSMSNYSSSSSEEIMMVRRPVDPRNHRPASRQSYKMDNYGPVDDRIRRGSRELRFDNQVNNQRRGSYQNSPRRSLSASGRREPGFDAYDNNIRRRSYQNSPRRSLSASGRDSRVIHHYMDSGQVYHHGYPQQDVRYNYSNHYNNYREDPYYGRSGNRSPRDYHRVKKYNQDPVYFHGSANNRIKPMIATRSRSNSYAQNRTYYEPEPLYLHGSSRSNIQPTLQQKSHSGTYIPNRATASFGRYPQDDYNSRPMLYPENMENPNNRSGSRRVPERMRSRSGSAVHLSPNGKVHIVDEIPEQLVRNEIVEIARSM